MRIYKGLEDFIGVKNPVFTTGTFDGVHKGHVKILERLKEIAAKNSGESVLLTFSPHPRTVLFPDDKSLEMINTQEEKIALFEKQGIDHLIIYPFTQEFSRLSSVEFIRDFLVNRIGISTLVIGYDHRFGRNREGSMEQLREFAPIYEFDIVEIPAEFINDVDISSTKIRRALHVGDIKTANSYLGYDYFLGGNVMKGTRIGRSIGFPTANIDIEDKLKLVPEDGVYAVKVDIEQKTFNGMLNIGVRPTINPGKENKRKKSIEVHIFEFEEDIYSKRISVRFKRRIRSEKKFDDIGTLKHQLVIDRNKSIVILEKY